MKKILVLFIGIILSANIFAQPFSSITDGESGLDVRTTLNNIITYLNDLGYDIEFSVDASSWHYGWASGDLYVRFSDDWGSTWSDEVFLWDGEAVNYFNTDTLVLSGDTITSFEFAAWDSLVYTSDDYLQWWNSGSVIDSVFIPQNDQYVYEIELPIAGTLSGSIAAAVEGTDYPTGWNLSASGGNLEIGHNLSRYVANVTVFYNTSGTAYRQLVNFQTAYNNIHNYSDDSLSVVSISEYYSQYKLKVYLLFK